jgi:hypothetical protein
VIDVPEHPNGGWRFRVQASQYIQRELKRLQRQAIHESRGEEMVAAFQQIIEQLQHDPWHAGKPLYRLDALRLQVRSVAIVPLVIHFGICEDRPFVFLRAAKLLSPPPP